MSIPVNAREGEISSDDAQPDRPDNPTKTRAKEGMGGLAKGLAILEAFGESTTRMTISDAAEYADLSRAAARRCLLTLVELGYLAYDGKFFTPLPRMLRLGSAYLNTSSLFQIAHPLLSEARDELQESVSLAVLDGGYSVFVARAESTHIVSTGAKVGGRLPVYCSATGRVLVSRMAEDEIRQHLDRVAMKKLTTHTLTSINSVMDAIRRSRADGYAISDEELEKGLCSVAVPVIDRNGAICAAVSVSAYSGRVNIETLEKTFLPVLQHTAQRIERAL